LLLHHVCQEKEALEVKVKIILNGEGYCPAREKRMFSLMANMHLRKNNPVPVLSTNPFVYPDLLSKGEMTSDLSFSKFIQILNEIFAFGCGQLGHQGQFIFTMNLGEVGPCYTDLTISIQPKEPIFALTNAEVDRLMQKYGCKYKETTYIEKKGVVKAVRFLLRLPIS
jgi:hypothetical protein